MAKTQTSSSRLTTLAEKNIQEKLSLTADGIVQEGMGDIYISVEVVSDVSLSAPTAACEACGEEASFVTSATLEKTTEEYLMPLICTDSYGNFQKVVRTSNTDDTIEDLSSPRIIHDTEITP